VALSGCGELAVTAVAPAIHNAVGAIFPSVERQISEGPARGSWGIALAIIERSESGARGESIVGNGPGILTPVP